MGLKKMAVIINKVIIKKVHTGESGAIFGGVPNISYVRLYVPEGSELLEAGGFVYPPEEAFHVPEDWYDKDIHVEQFEKEVNVHMKTGTRVVNEFDKTSFGNWMITNPGEESEVYFIYKLPFDITFVKDNNKDENFLTSFFSGMSDKLKYSLVVQKQSGVDSVFSSQIKLPADWSFVWNSKGTQLTSEDLLTFRTVLIKDTVLGAVIKGEIKNN